MAPSVLTIAGSDSSGGAGLQADLKVFHRCGCYGMSVVTLVTAQNTRAVRRIDCLPAEAVRAQIAAVWEDLPPAAVKTGALGEPAIMRAVAEELAARRGPPLVVDPVLVSKHGQALASADAAACLRSLLLPLATIVTPNLHELQALSGLAIDSAAAAQRAGARLRELGAAAVLVKGVPGSPFALDLLLDADGVLELPAPRLATGAGHGSGCSYAAAIAAQLARGRPLRTAVVYAKAYVTAALASALPRGGGHAPLDHWA
ncbi:MAG: bifunctional hydroxymethylpyrimidine kinase/phosphomethylpyrimidine kinase [Planctomycetota bacterium]|nr:bifunctional hydroxymethylpyrimidine kinase/phosphomethylpyrimidine kinase [Planctomycetota bacterium]MCX8040471.1 bifunctional hydroxymethylpyrimidine kinase/phosphomethylpyrimidine kinase [Planctomycetota bacterium]MDW8373219.1 bifunctional hydroxymethylpyrimidine kinase/phosphomethylpyrimidine kinase [Planctomycetota bacterium]